MTHTINKTIWQIAGEDWSGYSREVRQVLDTLLDMAEQGPVERQIARATAMELIKRIDISAK